MKLSIWSQVVISTYQSVTGTGTAAVTQMNNKEKA